MLRKHMGEANVDLPNDPQDNLSILIGKNFSSVNDLDDDELSPCRFTHRNPDAKPRACEQNEYKNDTPSIKFEKQLILSILKLTVTNSTLGTIFPEWSSTNNFIEQYVQEVDPVQMSADTRQIFLTYIRDLNARIVALNGLKSSIIAGTFSASLEGINKDWHNWRESWQVSPPHRVARFQRELTNKGNSQRIPVCYVRHKVYNSITNLEDKKANSSNTWLKIDEKCTGVQSFDTFLHTIQDYTEHAYKKATPENFNDRRLFLVAAHRGLGKGTFLSAFSCPAGLSQNIVSSWPKSTSSWPFIFKTSSPCVDYISAIFVNLSFSTEVASIFDMTINAILDSTASISQLNETQFSPKPSFEDIKKLQFEGSSGDQPKGISNEMWADRCNKRSSFEKVLKEQPRTEQLKTALHQFNDQSTKYAVKHGHKIRLLFVLSASNLMQTSDGHSKNREIQSFFEFLASKDISTYPIDIVSIENEGQINRAFYSRKEDQISSSSKCTTSLSDGSNSYLNLVPIIENNAEPKVRQSILLRIQHSNIKLTDDLIKIVKKNQYPDNGRMGKQCMIHFANYMNPNIFLVDNYLPLASMLFLSHYSKKSKDFEWADKIVRSFKDGQPSYEDQTKSIWEEKSRIRRKLKDSEDTTTRYIEGFSADINERLISNSQSFENDDAKNGISIKQKIDSEIKIHPPKERNATHLRKFLNSLDIDHNFYLQEWNEVRSALHGNRFCITILLAAANKIFEKTGKDIPAANKAKRFVHNTITHVKNASKSRIEDVVMEKVLDSYETFHIIGCPRNDVDFHHLLLRHLAVVGGPCSADVLAKMPDIRNYFHHLNEDEYKSHYARIVEALTELSLRGLVFRIHPHPRLIEISKKRNSQNGDQKSESRYALHRLTQRHIIRKLGAESKEFIEINRFSPSLYASMPAELPRLTPDAYSFLRVLVASLSQYPDRPNLEWETETWHMQLSKEKSTKVQALRAALSLLRSTFSVAVVSRFENYKTLDAQLDLPPRGYFETYRIQARWLIRKAWELLDPEEKENPARFDPTKKREKLNAFYRDEIVWLYNECGLVCLGSKLINL